MANQLIRKSGIYLVGNAATKLLSVVLVPIYAIFVSPNDLGLFDFIQTVAGLASIVFFAAAWESIIRFAMARDSTMRASETIRATVVISLLGCAGLVLCTATTIAFAGGQGYLVLAGGVIACLTGLLNVWQYAARATGHSRLFVLSGIVSAVVNLALVVILVCLLRGGVDALAISFAAGLTSAIVVLEVKLRLLRISTWAWPPRRVLLAVLEFTWPLMLNLLGTFLLAGFGRILITTTLGAEANGQFAFAMKVAVVVTALGQVLSMASLEETVSRIGSAGIGHFYSTLISSVWALMLSGGALTIFASSVFFEVLGDTQYSKSLPLIPVLVLWGVFTILVTNYGNVFQVANKTRVIAWTTLAGLVVAIVGSYFTIHSGGPVAVSLWMCGGMLVTLIARRTLARSFVQFRENKTVILPGIGYAAASAIALSGLEPVVAMILGGVVAASSIVLFLLALRDLRRVPDAVPIEDAGDDPEYIQDATSETEQN